MLLGLNRFWDLRLTQEELLKIGATLGSDVPFLLQGGTAVSYTPLDVYKRQICTQENLTIRDGDYVCWDVCRYVTRLRFDNRQRCNGTATKFR